VFENRVLRRIFGPKRDEVTGEWKKLHTEELHNLKCNAPSSISFRCIFHNLYSSPSILRHIKSRSMWWVGHVARMGEKSVGGFDRKARRKKTTLKTQA
jgi:hypothetical protein